MINPTNLTARRKWTPDEEGALMDICNSYDLKDGEYHPWGRVAAELVKATLNLRTAKGCSSRYLKVLRSGSIAPKEKEVTAKDQRLRDIADMFISWLREELEVRS